MQFFTLASTTMSAGTVQELQGHMPSTYHLKDVNNDNGFFGTDSYLQSVSR